MNNKGISLIALAVMIIVMIIIAAIAYTNSFDAHDKAMIAREKEENMNVTNAIQNRFGEYMASSTINPLSGIIIPNDLTTTSEMEEFIINYLHENGKLYTERNAEFKAGIRKLLEDNKDHPEYTRILEHTHLIDLGIENLPTDSMYVVNYYGMTVVGPIY